MGAILNISKDWEYAEDTWSFLQHLLKEIPEDLNACESIFTDMISYLMHVAGITSFSILFSKLISPSTYVSNGMTLIGKGSDVFSAFSSGDFYRFGQDFGAIIHLALTLGMYE